MSNVETILRITTGMRLNDTFLREKTTAKELDNFLNNFYYHKMKSTFTWCESSCEYSASHFIVMRVRAENKENKLILEDLYHVSP